MIYNGFKKYGLRFYQNLATRENPIDDYLNNLGKKERAKIVKYLEVLKRSNNLIATYLVKHIRGKIWELRVDFSSKRYRLLYCILDRQIVILHIFLKKTAKSPNLEISIALKRYEETLKHEEIYK